MYYVCKEYSKQDIENQIKYAFKIQTECCINTKGYFPKTGALNIILYFAFCSEYWNEQLNCPTSNYTVNENIGIRYHLYSPTNHDVIYNPLKKEDALLLCEKILNNMVNKKIVIISKSGKGVKYINQDTAFISNKNYEN